MWPRKPSYHTTGILRNKMLFSRIHFSMFPSLNCTIQLSTKQSTYQNCFSHAQDMGSQNILCACHSLHKPLIWLPWKLAHAACCKSNKIIFTDVCTHYKDWSLVRVNRLWEQLNNWVTRKTQAHNNFELSNNVFYLTTKCHFLCEMHATRLFTTTCMYYSMRHVWHCHCMYMTHTWNFKLGLYTSTSIQFFLEFSTRVGTIAHR